MLLIIAYIPITPQTPATSMSPDKEELPGYYRLELPAVLIF